MIKVKALIYNEPTQVSLTTSNKFITDRINQIKSEQYKTSSALAYTLLDAMLKEAFNLTLNDVELAENEYGKPIIIDQSIHFNISHSSNAVICAVSDTEIGVDIEKITNIHEAVLKKCFTSSEQESIRTPEDFYRLWTLKEAYLKAVGTGINRKLNTISFCLGENIICSENGSAVPYYFRSIVSDEYAFSVCSPQALAYDFITIIKK